MKTHFSPISLTIVLCTFALSFRTSVFDMKGKKMLSDRSDGPENKLASFVFHLRPYEGPDSKFLEKAQGQSN